MSDWMPEPWPAHEETPDTTAEAMTTPAPDAAPYTPVPPAVAPLGITRTPTGDKGVDALLVRLADADGLPADGHTEVYEDVHRGLRDALTALDAPPAPAPPYNNRS